MKWRMNLQKNHELIADLEKTLKIGLRLKEVMQKKHLRVAKCVCPRCGDWIYGSLNGKRNHLHMACKGSCKMVYME